MPLGIARGEEHRTARGPHRSSKDATHWEFFIRVGATLRYLFDQIISGNGLPRLGNSQSRKDLARKLQLYSGGDFRYTGVVPKKDTAIGYL